jgi:hypothetical protein
MEVTVNYIGITLQLEGDVISSYSGRYEEESMLASFETQEVYIGGVLATNLFTEEQLTELDVLAIETLNEI